MARKAGTADLPLHGGHVPQERQRSPEYGGRSVSGWEAQAPTEGKLG